MRIPITLPCLLASALLLGCTTTTKDGSAVVTQPRPEPIPVGSLEVHSGTTALEMGWTSLVNRAVSSDVVLIGEQHTHDVGQYAAADLFEEITRRRGSDVALALEFFERDHQVHLDDYATGIIDEQQLAELQSGSFPEGHRRMVRAAQAAGARIVAANAPRRYVRLVRTGPERLDELTALQRSLVVVPPSVIAGPYRDRFMALSSGMTGQAHGHGDPEAFYLAQNVWDATMAESVVTALDAGASPVVLVVGQFHVDYEGGLTERIRRLRPDARILTVSMQDAWASELRAEDRDRADAVVYVGPLPE